MNEGFISFKKKILLRHLIVSLISSLSAFLIVFGIFFLLTKLKVTNINIGLDILFGVIAFGIVFVILYFGFKPKDKKIAKMLDKQFNLQEKVQTMVELKDNDSFIANLQREDCESKLKNISLKDLKFKLPIFLILAAFLGVTTTVVASAVPQKIINTDTDDPVIPTNELLKKLEELKTKVSEYKIDSTLKSNYIAEIDNIITLVNNEASMDSLKIAASKAVDNVLVLNKNYSSNKAIGRALNAIENQKYADQNTSANPFVGTFATFTDPNYKIKITDTSIELNSQTYAIKTENISKTTESITASLPEDESSIVTINRVMDKVNTITFNNQEFYLCEDFMYYKAIGRALYNYNDKLANYFKFLTDDYASTKANWNAFLKKRFLLESQALNKVLEASQLDKDNEYYSALEEYISVVDSLQTIGSSQLIDTITPAINKLQERFSAKFEDELNANNCADLIDTTLRSIFELEKKSEDTDKLESEDDAKINTDNEDDSNKSDSDKWGGNGGSGDGDPQYASNDKFFALDENGEPAFTDDKGLYAYAHFYAEYLALYTNLVQDGTLTNQEIVDYLNDYFSKLVSGLNNK